MHSLTHHSQALNVPPRDHLVPMGQPDAKLANRNHLLVGVGNILGEQQDWQVSRTMHTPSVRHDQYSP